MVQRVGVDIVVNLFSFGEIRWTNLSKDLKSGRTRVSNRAAQASRRVEERVCLTEQHKPVEELFFRTNFGANY